MNSLLKDILTPNLESLKSNGAFRNLEHNIKQGYFTYDRGLKCGGIFLQVKGGTSARAVKKIMCSSLSRVKELAQTQDYSTLLGVQTCACPEKWRPKFDYSSSFWLVGLIAVRNISHDFVENLEAFENSEVELSSPDSKVNTVLRKLPHCKVSTIPFIKNESESDYHLILHGI